MPVTFVANNVLQDYIDIHTGENHECQEIWMYNLCKSNYARKASLNTHVKQKHEHDMKCSDDGDENIKVVNPIDPNEVPNAGTLVDRGTPNEGVGNFNNISSGMI